MYSYDEYVPIACQRGCRLFFVIDIQNDHYDNQSNVTLAECVTSCKESYVNLQDRNSCNMGCTMIQNAMEAIPSNFTIREKDILLYKYLNKVQNQMKSYISIFHETLEDFMKNKNLPNETNSFNFEEKIGDWLECTSKNSGIPKGLLLFAFFSALLAFTYLCFSADKPSSDNFNRNESGSSLIVHVDPNNEYDKKIDQGFRFVK